VGNYSGEKYLVMDGPDFRRAVLDGEGEIRQDVFDLVWSRLRVLARCSPADKYTIVQGALILQTAEALSSPAVGCTCCAGL
jgi:magnesium-transporting ATPase (P-type)